MAEYVDFAEYYDFDHAITQDVGFYLDFAHRCRSPILELACGTGRLVIPLAEAGFEVYGVDVSENMLAICRRKVAENHGGVIYARSIPGEGSVFTVLLPAEEMISDE